MPTTPARDPVPTRTRLLAEALRLFGERGYAATTIAAIEEAAGLSPGSGALYKHFRSKADILAEGITQLIGEGAPLRALLGGTAGTPEAAALDRLPLTDRLAFVAVAGLRRLEQERDFNRILLRDLKDCPELLDRAGNDEIRDNHRGLTRWLAAQAEAAGGDLDRDWEALAAVTMNATAHYWLLRDVFGGEHPTGVSEERYVRALADLVAALVAPNTPAGEGSDAPGQDPEGRDRAPGPAQNPPRQGQLP